MGSYYVNHFTYIFFHLKIWQDHLSMSVKYIPTLLLSPLITSSCSKLPMPMASGTGHASCISDNFFIPSTYNGGSYPGLLLYLYFRHFNFFSSLEPNCQRHFHFTVLFSLQESPDLCFLFKAVSPSNSHVCW